VNRRKRRSPASLKPAGDWLLFASLNLAPIVNPDSFRVAHSRTRRRDLRTPSRARRFGFVPFELVVRNSFVPMSPWACAARFVRAVVGDDGVVLRPGRGIHRHRASASPQHDRRGMSGCHSKADTIRGIAGIGRLPCPDHAPLRRRSGPTRRKIPRTKDDAVILPSAFVRQEGRSNVVQKCCSRAIAWTTPKVAQRRTPGDGGRRTTACRSRADVAVKNWARARVTRMPSASPPGSPRCRGPSASCNRCAGYALSPIDIIPDLITVVRYLDRSDLVNSGRWLGSR